MKKIINNIKKLNTDTLTRLQQLDNIIVFFLLLILLSIPLLIKARGIHFVSPTITSFTFLQTGDKIEFFTYYKFLLLLIFTSIISLLFLIKLFVFKYEIQKTKMNIFLMLFIIILLLSTFLSSSQYLALTGFYDRHVGLLTFLCYSFILFIASNVRYSKKTIKLFFYMVTPFVIINSTLSLLNFYGYNILKQNFVEKFVLSNNFGTHVSLGEGSRLAGTLNNADYIGGISSLFICLFFVLSIFEKSKKLKIINIVLLFSSVAMLLSSLSSGGFIAIFILLPTFLIILLIKKEFKKFLLGISLIITFSLVYIPLQNHNNSVWNESFGTLNMLVSKQDISKTSQSSAPSDTPKNDLQTSKFELPKVPEKGMSFGSGRGYIWKNTLGIISEKPLVGYGLDTFPYNFPQYKLAQLSGLGATLITDKPHSLYLGIAVGTGAVGLILFFLLIGPPILDGIFSVIKRKDLAFTNASDYLAILFLLLAYLIQGLVNDSNVGSDIFFFVFFGIFNSIRLDREKIS